MGQWVGEVRRGDRGVWAPGGWRGRRTAISWCHLYPSTRPNFFPYKQDENFLLHDFNQPACPLSLDHIDTEVRT